MNYYYTSSTLTLAEITSLYLYGQPTTPSNLASTALVRPPEVAPDQPGMTIVYLDPVEFMATGPVTKE